VDAASPIVGAGTLPDVSRRYHLDMDPVSPDRRARRWRVLAVFAASLVPGAMDLTRKVAMGVSIDLASMTLSSIGVLLLLGVLTAAFDFATSRRMTAARCFALTSGVAVGFSIAESFATWLLAAAFGLPVMEPAHRSVAVVVRMGVASGVLGLGLFAMAVALPFAASGAREADRLRATAELTRLRANLQPHFLFNTLSTVSGLVGEDPREARRLIGALGDLLRDSLVDSEADDMQTLDDEITWLKHYADILETRHRGSISFRWEIDERAGCVRIPRLLLQPLVENAVKHGALRRPEGGEVAVRATVGAHADGRLTCVVEDNGPGPLARAPRVGARGLDLVRRRLSLKYDRGAEFRLESGDGRTRSIVILPSGRAS
jgi:signal transduction histidine kinase